METRLGWVLGRIRKLGLSRLRDRPIAVGETIMADDVTQSKSGDSPSVLDPDLGKDAPMPRDVTKPESAPAPTVAEESEELDEDLDAQVGEMIAEARRQEDLEDEPEEAGAEAPEPVETDPMPDADKAKATSLSDLAFELLESDLDDLTELDTPATPAEAPTDVAPAGVAHSEPQSATPGENAHAKDDSESAPDDASVWQRIWSEMRRVGMLVWKKALPLSARGVIEVNRPLNSRSDAVRQTVGWLALYTAFLGVCVWVYVLLVRTPPETIATDTPAGLVAEPQGSGSTGSPSPVSSASLSDARQD